jgi:probable HAF family extracellular repeat protein
LLAIFISPLPAAADVFTPLGFIPGGTSSEGFDISPEGSVALGQSGTSEFQEAFRWTEQNGMVALGILPGDGAAMSEANGASESGNVVIVGRSRIGSSLGAIHWTSGTGMSDLGVGADSTATDVSADGLVIVGHYLSANGREAYRWTMGGGVMGLADLPGGAFASEAHGISGDGQVIVGHGRNNLDFTEAFRWTAGSGMQGLGFLPGGIDPQSRAFGTCVDGTVVVGDSRAGANSVAIRWTMADGMQSLGALPGDIESVAFDTSANGSFVVGHSDAGGGNNSRVRLGCDARNAGP